MPPRQVAQEDLEPGKRYYIIDIDVSKSALATRRVSLDNDYLDPVLGPIRCRKWVGTFRENIIGETLIKSHFSDVDCIGTPLTRVGISNKFIEYHVDSVIHIGERKFANLLKKYDKKGHFAFYEKFEVSEETRVNRIMAKKIDPLFSWSMATEPGNVTPYIAATAIRQRRHPPETTSDIGAATTTGGRRHYSRKNKKKRQKKRRNTKSKKYRK